MMKNTTIMLCSDFSQESSDTQTSYQSFELTMCSRESKVKYVTVVNTEDDSSALWQKSGAFHNMTFKILNFAFEIKT